ncbi:hypothetical protein C9374_005602 [Naegleria lovaniensis]|uniref:Uncharacterized protein n=1 Tax=Naegleria lovaniensis TaxID=51637 RepID=A0AA88KK88_NAELO|nr:uncharacterized protein C9374_005602 [Naegleria lovaniensis]KAG2382400.1 hypothetical protein C9374_005602 [Naegleria lovaniensis]
MPGPLRTTNIVFAYPEPPQREKPNPKYSLPTPKLTDAHQHFSNQNHVDASLESVRPKPNYSSRMSTMGEVIKLDDNIRPQTSHGVAGERNLSRFSPSSPTFSHNNSSHHSKIHHSPSQTKADHHKHRHSLSSEKKSKHPEGGVSHSPHAVSSLQAVEGSTAAASSELAHKPEATPTGQEVSVSNDKPAVEEPVMSKEPQLPTSSNEKPSSRSARHTSSISMSESVVAEGETVFWKRKNRESRKDDKLTIGLAEYFEKKDENQVQPLLRKKAPPPTPRKEAISRVKVVEPPQPKEEPRVSRVKRSAPPTIPEKNRGKAKPKTTTK